eukprot:5955069-Karenia_brevis.AAC.1
MDTATKSRLSVSGRASTGYPASGVDATDDHQLVDLQLSMKAIAQKQECQERRITSIEASLYRTMAL